MSNPTLSLPAAALCLKVTSEVLLMSKEACQSWFSSSCLPLKVAIKNQFYITSELLIGLFTFCFVGLFYQVLNKVFFNAMKAIYIVAICTFFSLFCPKRNWRQYSRTPITRILKGKEKQFERSQFQLSGFFCTYAKLFRTSKVYYGIMYYVLWPLCKFTSGEQILPSSLVLKL